MGLYDNIGNTPSEFLLILKTLLRRAKFLLNKFVMIIVMGVFLVPLLLAVHDHWHPGNYILNAFEPLSSNLQTLI